ncbi:MAG: 3-deoxy-7-phosphoheptulonate synthase [Candidatus Aureabacteria bacterium]|nr:3-deoxy-7-phosphoheptulonate synthase [Candidatus Auribacterota bacterium]
MIIVLKPGASQEQLDHIVSKVHELGLKTMISQGVERTIIGVIGEEDILRITPLEVFPGVEKVLPVLKPYKLVSREFKPESTVVAVKGVRIGSRSIQIAAGPCAVENREMLFATAKAVKAAGAGMIRGGAFKPRTSPYTFQGLGEEGLKYLREVSDATGMPAVTECMDPRDVALVESYADIIQVGARNMQNITLLRELGQVKKPILLKRGMMSTVKELLMSAEYILSNGNFNVILCERGIRTFEDATRNTLDLSMVPLVKRLSHLPVFVDPSHGTGVRELIEPMSIAAIAAGADGLIIEVHINPEAALSDGAQSLTPDEFARLMKGLAPVAKAVGRELQ